MEQHVSEMNWRVWKFRMSRTLKPEFERYCELRAFEDNTAHPIIMGVRSIKHIT